MISSIKIDSFVNNSLAFTRSVPWGVEHATLLKSYSIVVIPWPFSTLTHLVWQLPINMNFDMSCMWSL